MQLTVIHFVLDAHFKQLKYETKSRGINQLKSQLLYYRNIIILGLDSVNGIEYTYQKEDGSTETVQYTESDFITYEEYETLKSIYSTNSSNFVSYTIDASNSLALLTLNQCTFNDEYRNCVKKMFTEIKQQGIENVAVDLRKNGGGSSFVANEFIRYLDVEQYRTDTETLWFGCFHMQIMSSKNTNKRFEDLLFHGNVYVLTSYNTFSSAMNFAGYIKDNDLGTLVGEAPGNLPNGYGEVVTFQLPNSRLYLCVSCAAFTRADTTTTDELVEPDIYCESNDAIPMLYELIKK